MTRIGIFKRTTSEEFVGEIVTLSVQAKNVRMIPEEFAASSPPTAYRVYAGRAQIGNARRTSADNSNWSLAVDIDDPSFAAPVFAHLIEADELETYHLMWDRHRVS